MSCSRVLFIVNTSLPGGGQGAEQAGRSSSSPGETNPGIPGFGVAGLSLTAQQRFLLFTHLACPSTGSSAMGMKRKGLFSCAACHPGRHWECVPGRWNQQRSELWNLNKLPLRMPKQAGFVCLILMRVLAQRVIPAWMSWSWCNVVEWKFGEDINEKSRGNARQVSLLVNDSPMNAVQTVSV